MGESGVHEADQSQSNCYMSSSMHGKLALGSHVCNRTMEMSWVVFPFPALDV